MSMQVESAVNFYDNHPEPADFYSEVIEGLKLKDRRIPPKFFYDEKGSMLFDAICNSPEYYVTRTEMAILQEKADAIASLVGNRCLLIEPGSGSSQKVRLLLDELRPEAYVPMDISKAFLLKAAHKISNDYPWLDVHATCIDFTDSMELSFCPLDTHNVAFFPGSSIGNFEYLQAIEFLKNIAELVGEGGGLLIGVDLKKDHEILNAAYNDKQGITANFNLNLLERINKELDADFEIDGFSHHAFYNNDKGRVEMHLLSQRNQVVNIASEQFGFSENESIHTENSYKYTVDEFIGLAEKSGFISRQVWIDDENLFSLHYLEVA